MPMLEVVFWLTLIVGLYPHFLYPVLAWLLGFILNRSIARDDAFEPKVTVLTAAFNEAAWIEATVRNKLQQDYPAAKLELIVVSDSSDDGTDDIVTMVGRESGRVLLIRQTPRRGKTAALNLGIAKARGDIIVFSDANSLYQPNAVRKLVRNFSDPQVGYVTGRMLYANPDGSLVGDGCSAFMRYENSLRVAETRLGSIVGVDGGIDAVRRSLYQPMRPDQLPDFVLPLHVVGQGYRVIYEPDAILTEDTLTDSTSEYRMRVRVALRALWALWDNRSLLNPMRAGLFAWQLASHKLLRYMSFAFLGTAAALAWVLASRGVVYGAAAALQVVFVVLVAIAYFGPKALASRPLPRYCGYFLLLNVASAVALLRFIRGKKQVLWQPRTG